MARIICKVFLILVLFYCPAFAASPGKKEVKKGNLLYNEGKFEESLKQYEEAFILTPDSDIVNFNLGAALYKIQDYEGAMEYFRKALVSENPSLEQKASYNIGNAEYKFGISREEKDLSAAVNWLKQALHHYTRALEIDSEDEDARYNYEFVKKELRRLEQKAEKQAEAEQQKDNSLSQAQEKGEASKQERSEAEQQEREERRQQAQERGKESRDEKSLSRQQAGQEKLEQAEKNAQSKNGSEAYEQNEKISEEEALMLLEGYRQEEEPEGLYKEKIPVKGPERVLKDW